MDINLWTTYLFASVLIAVSPGSGAILSMSHGVRFGVRRTGATILGLECGLVVILLIAGAGVGSLLVASEVAFNIVKFLGAGYLVYLGFSQWRSAVPNAESTGFMSPKKGLPEVFTWRRRYAAGLFTNMTNPKGIVFMVAVLPQFVIQNRPLGLQLLVMALTTVTVDVVVMHGYALAGRSMQNLFRNARAFKIQNRIFGGLLMAIGTGLLFVKRGNDSL
ncbi:LysE family transporter [Glaciimonas sp. Gout2]|uniref:LysE family translocator n=1 Tax=unclassified Glaciimonas TaxID=2644401 RepID=UPI002AB57A11|nr:MULTISPECIES: LysE family transporter [unclassified Glaciimonas]MDY7548577.1 LysE family transporter [Glaciimonas sp. CA11.2]MEB0013764.1 LysE family transporter [Glaciimonas sp. Cout2]MEB0083369.1 LysE family transporter [Glaciimonas sp. Gout2]